jgi:hypothetical protein
MLLITESIRDQLYWYNTSNTTGGKMQYYVTSANFTSRCWAIRLLQITVVGKEKMVLCMLPALGPLYQQGPINRNKGQTAICCWGPAVLSSDETSCFDDSFCFRPSLLLLVFGPRVLGTWFVSLTCNRQDENITSATKTNNPCELVNLGRSFKCSCHDILKLTLRLAWKLTLFVESHFKA